MAKKITTPQNTRISPAESRKALAGGVSNSTIMKYKAEYAKAMKPKKKKVK